MDNMPDFDNMTPEEMMKWMESLAKRQGATEGLTTAADMEIAEIDPDQVVIDEPGYIPFGQEGKQPKAEPAKAPPPKPEPAKALPPKPEPAKAPPPEPVKVAPPVVEKPAPPPRPAAPVVSPPPAPAQRPAAQVPVPAPAEEGGLAWLESLAGGQDDNSLFNLDLGSLPAVEERAPSAVEPATSLSWLEDLARGQDEPLAAAAPARPADPFGGSDSVEWLETLARRQGADSEELITPAQLDIPLPDEAEIEAPGYVAFSFDSPPVTNRAPAPTLSDPNDFLSSLTGDAPAAEPEAAAEDLSLDAIQQAIAAGTVTREQMQVFLDAQADSIAAAPEIEFVETDEDGELAPADLPPWLLEQVGAPPSGEPAPTVSMDALFPESVVDDDMPEWLKQNVEEGDSQIDFGGLLGQMPEPVVAEVVPPVEIDPSDTWAEAFDLEHEGGIVDVDAVPDWYKRNVKDPARIAAVEQLERQFSEDELIDAALPVEELPVGEAQSVPSWVVTPPPVEETPVAAAETEFSDWLSGLEVTEAEVPEWLSDTLTEAPPAEVFEPEPEPEPVVFQRAPQPPPIPAAPPRPAASSAALERARDREQNGDLEGSLSEYEGMIRANVDLDAVVADLAQLVKSYRTVPAVYRVLGDGLMRQGKLQQALNTYREALNQL